MSITAMIFTVIGYLSGSILYAELFCALFRKKEAYLQGSDHNPGTANAYMYGGFWCGTLTLIFDLMKGFLPVFLYLRLQPLESWELVPVMTAPVIGHIFPLFKKFQGGKGIAATFGCLLGLFPYIKPVVIFAAAFIFFSVVLRISPHFYRTVFAYVFSLAGMLLTKVFPVVSTGFLIIMAAVLIRMHFSNEDKKRLEVKTLWTR